MAISGRTRVEVFTRDGFTCLYCGKRNEALHVDHVHPKSKGGRDSLDNYVTACQTCNLGKASRPIFPQGMSLTSVLSRQEPGVPLFQWTAADLVRRPWLRLVCVVSIAWDARWYPSWHSDDYLEADALAFEQQTRALVETVIELCDLARGDLWYIEMFICDLTSHIGWASTFDEFMAQSRRYCAHWKAHLLGADT